MEWGTQQGGMHERRGGRGECRALGDKGLLTHAFNCHTNIRTCMHNTLACCMCMHVRALTHAFTHTRVHTHAHLYIMPPTLWPGVSEEECDWSG